MATKKVIKLYLINLQNVHNFIIVSANTPVNNFHISGTCRHVIGVLVCNLTRHFPVLCPTNYIYYDSVLPLSNQFGTDLKHVML